MIKPVSRFGHTRCQFGQVLLVFWGELTTLEFPTDGILKDKCLSLKLLTGELCFARISLRSHLSLKGMEYRLRSQGVLNKLGV
jgi:hypothetical protein